MDYLADAIAADSRLCSECPLRDSPYVVSDGYPDCPLMCVGTAPGRVEELSGIAFTGKAGELLREVLAGLGFFDRVYYTNVIRRRPTREDGENRKPSAKECWKCGSHLISDIVRHRPTVVLSVGRVPLSFLTGSSLELAQIHGLPIPVKRFGLSFLVIPVYDASLVMRKGLHSNFGNNWLCDMEEFAKLAHENT